MRNNRTYQGGTIRNNASVISELPQENNKSEIFTQTIEPRKGHQVDKYQGPVDPVSRLRHGVGTYHYPNKLFTYHGNFSQGIKVGEGTLEMSDGTTIKGTFQNNQLNGPGEIKYSNGSTYTGTLEMGEKSGFGKYKSLLQEYEGQFKSNKRHGKGSLKTRNCSIVGTFEDNKPHGPQVCVKKYNYSYVGGFACGEKSGTGKQVSSFYDENYQYEGEFQRDKFQGKGKYCDQSNGRVKDNSYIYDGDFKAGVPMIYPNQFRVSLASAAAGTLPEGEEKPQEYVDITNSEAPIEYEVQSENQLYLLIECCYQAPEELDPNQPTQQEVEKMVKDWEAQNKKNKNPPPMPDFNQPRMIKPELVVVEAESCRPLELRLGKGEVPPEKSEDEAKIEYMKVDYRQLLTEKRVQNEQIKAQNTKKAEEQGAKKGGKGNAKGGQVELKLNCFVENHKKCEETLNVGACSGKCQINKLEFPDDMPQGSYHLIVSSPFQKFGQVKCFQKNINIKAKNAGGKKK